MLNLVLAVLAGSPAPTVRVDGDGYLRLSRDGRTVFARSVNVEIIQGKLGGNGAVFLPAISCSGDVSGIEIDLEGNVTQAGNLVGRLVLAVFPGAAPQSQGAFFVAQDRPRLVNPGDDNAGVIRFGAVAAAKPMQPKQPLVNSAPTTEPKAETKTASTLIPTPPAGGIGIGFRTEVAISGEQFTLGDIAEFSGNSQLIDKASRIVVGTTPVVGAPRMVDTERVLAKLRGAGVDLRLVRLGIAKVKVSRAGQVATDDEFVSAAIAAAETRFGKYGDLVAQKQQPDMSLPQGEKKFLVDDLDASRDGYRAVVSVWVDGRCINRRIVTLDRSNAPTLPRMGETVKVRVCANNLRLETTGRVTRVGKPGEPVEVTTANGAKLLAMPIGPGLVEAK